MNLALNIMVVVMFTVVHWYKEEAVESRKPILYVLIAVYISDLQFGSVCWHMMP